MAEKDINGMQAQHWPAKDASLTQKVADNLKIIVSDPKLRSLYEALTAVIIASVKDSYGKSSDKKYIYQTDMLMARVRKALSDKLPDLQTDSIKQMISDGSDKTSETMSKLLLTAFKSLSVSIDKDAQSELISKIAAATDKLLQDYITKVDSGKNQTAEKKSTKKRKKTSQKQKAQKSELSKVLDVLKTDKNASQAKEDEIKRYQKKTSDLISKTLNTVNKSHKISIESMTAGFKHTSQTISNEVSQLQDKLEDVQSSSVGGGATSWFKTFIMEPVKLLLGGLWKFLLKPMFYVGKFLLKPIGFLVKGIWDNFIKKPISKLLELTGNVLGTLTSAASTALSVFFLTPKGAYALGYAIGYVWGRWLKPTVMPMIDFFKDKVLPIAKDIAKWSFKKIEDLMYYIGKPLLKMFNGDESFNEAMKDLLFKWILGDDIYKKDENGDKIKQTDDKGNVLLQKDGITPKYAMKDWSSLIYDSVIKALKTFLDLKVPGLNWSFSAFGKTFTIGTIKHWMYVLAAIQVLNAGARAINAAANLYKGYKQAAQIGTKILRHKATQTIAEKTAIATIKKGAVKTAEKTAIASMTKKELIKELQNAGSTMSANQLKKQTVKQLRKAAEREAEKKIAKTATELAAKKGGVAVGKTVGKSVLKKIPLIGLVAGAGFAIQSAMNGDYTGAGLELASGAASLLPGVGTAASIAIDVANGAREINNTLNSAKNAAESISDDIDITKNATKNTVYEVTANIDTTKTEQIVAEQQAKIDNLLSDTLKPLGTVTYIVNTKNDELERVKSNLLKEESAKQIGQLARDASKKAAEQSAQLTAKEYKNVLDAALGAYDLKTTKSSLADNMKLSQTMLKDVSDNQEEFLKRMDKLQTTLEQMFISKGKSQDEAKQASYFFINSFKDKYAPMSNKDRYQQYTDPLE